MWEVITNEEQIKPMYFLHDFLQQLTTAFIVIQYLFTITLI
jgi:hypothetical protein